MALAQPLTGIYTRYNSSCRLVGDMDTLAKRRWGGRWAGSSLWRSRKRPLFLMIVRCCQVAGFCCLCKPPFGNQVVQGVQVGMQVAYRNMHRRTRQAVIEPHGKPFQRVGYCLFKTILRAFHRPNILLTFHSFKKPYGTLVFKTN